MSDFGLARPAEPPAVRVMPAVRLAGTTGRLRQLDGLRGLAALGVIATHTWFPGGLLGDWRMRLFFVLSGFLICGILLHGRDLRAQGRTSVGHFVGSFYARRAIRLLPPMILTILVSRLVNYQMGESVWWHLAQSTNLYIALSADMMAGSLNHLWSLNIEEQFCLVFPALLLLAPEQCLVPLFIGGISAQAIYEATGAFLGWNAMSMAVLSPKFLGSFCLGGLLVTLTRRNARLSFLPYAAFLLLALTLLLTWLTPPSGATERAATIAAGTTLNLFICTVVGLAALERTGPFGAILRSRPLVEIGLLSYGIYLYHLPIAGVLLRLRLHYNLGPWAPGPLYFTVVVVMSVLAALLSRRYFETPLEHWKSAFPYASNQTARGTGGSQTNSA